MTETHHGRPSTNNSRKTVSVFGADGFGTCVVNARRIAGKLIGDMELFNAKTVKESFYSTVAQDMKWKDIVRLLKTRQILRKANSMALLQLNRRSGIFSRKLILDMVGSGWIPEDIFAAPSTISAWGTASSFMLIGEGHDGSTTRSFRRPSSSTQTDQLTGLGYGICYSFQFSFVDIHSSTSTYI